MDTPTGSAEARARAIRSAAVRPILAPGRFYWPAVLGLGALVLLAVAAYGYQVVSGLWVAGYSDRAFWGVYEADLVAFIGVSYGGALVSAILRVTNARWRAPLTRIAETTALVSLLVGASFAIVHVGRPERLWEIVAFGNLSSPIVWDFYAVLTYLVATVIFLYLPLIADAAILRTEPGPTSSGLRRHLYRLLALGWTGSTAQRRRLESAIGLIAILIIPLAISVHSVLSYAFSMTTRAGWHSTIFGPYFVVGAIYSGVALVIVVVAALRRAYRLELFITPRHLVLLGRLMVALALGYLYFTFSETLTGAYSGTTEDLSIVTTLLAGPYAPLFWLFVVAGVIVPIALVAVPGRRALERVVAAAVLAVVGMWLKRLLIVLPSATSPLVGQDWGSFQFTWVPIVITLGATAAIPLGLLVLFRFIPILAIDEMEHLMGSEAPAAETPKKEAEAWLAEPG